MDVGLAYADGGSTLSGQFTVGSSVGLNEQVFISGINTGASSATHADSDGNYSFPGLPDDSYYLNVYSSGGGMPNFSAISVDPFLNIAGSDTTDNINFPTNTLTATVKDTNNNPLSGAIVFANSSTSSSITADDGHAYSTSNISMSKTTDASGQATLPLFPGIDYQVCAALMPSSRVECTQTTFNGDSAIELDFTPGYTVSGQVTVDGVPIRDPVVNISGSAPSDNGSTQGDENGSYVLSDMPDDNYNIDLSYSGKPGVPSFSGISVNPYLNVNGGDATQSVSFTTTKITVTVENAAGDPISGAGLTTTGSGTGASDDGQPYLLNNVSVGNTADGSGTAVLNVLPGLTYQVCGYNPADGIEACNDTVTPDASGATIVLNLSD